MASDPIDPVALGTTRTSDADARIAELEHLLRVAAAENRDAANVWADLWKEFKGHVTPSGTLTPNMQKGFVPKGGWSAFLEKLWLLKHHLDSASRVCIRK